MIFETKIQFLLFLCNLKSIGIGAHGICYYDSINNKVYKVFHQFFDSHNNEFYIKYSNEDILKFSDKKNNTFIWASDTIIVNNEIVGYVSKYVNGKSLYQINPLSVNLNDLIKFLQVVKSDLEKISNAGIRTYDMMYNILMSTNGIYVIDHDEYSYSEIDNEKLFKINSDNFNIEIMYFLIDNYFDDFVFNNNELKEMYCSSGIDIIEFICKFKNYLSEYIGYEINQLSEIYKCINKKRIRKIKYQRILLDCEKNIDYL